MITITSELIKSWKIPNLIPDELLPIGVMGLFEASIPSNAKVRVLLREEVLGRRGLVYVAAKAARRACTKTGWNHAGSIQALDLCDRYAAGEEVSKEELELDAEAAARASWAASRAAEASATVSAAEASWAASSASWAAEASSAVSAASRASWAASAASSATNGEEERRTQLADCREWLMRNPPQERAPVLTRYQRIMRSL